MAWAALGRFVELEGCKVGAAAGERGEEIDHWACGREVGVDVAVEWGEVVPGREGLLVVGLAGDGELMGGFSWLLDVVPD